MAVNSSLETNTSFVSCATTDRKPSKTSTISKRKNDDDNSKIPKSVQPKKKIRARAKTADDSYKLQKNQAAESPGSGFDAESRTTQLSKGKSETWVGHNEPIMKLGSEEQSEISVQGLQPQRLALDENKKILMYKQPSETFSKLCPESHLSYCGKHSKPKASFQSKKLSEIPKSKLPPGTKSSKLPVKSRQLENRNDPALKTSKSKLHKTKKEGKAEDRIKNALKENFSDLVPLYNAKVKRVMDTWVDTIYCSLTMRNNLIKLLCQVFPTIDRSQFHMENKLLMQSIIRTKNNTKTEVDNLLQLIKTLLNSRIKTKEDYSAILANKEVAEDYNFNWKALATKISELAGETKQLQMEIPQLEKKKEAFEANANEKIQKMETTLEKKEEEIRKLSYQLGILKQRENSFKGNVLMKVDEYKDIKSDVVSLKKVENEFEELKMKYQYQNDMFEKKIKELEGILEEKRKSLDKEYENRKRLQILLTQLKAQQKHLCRTIGKDQVDFIMGRSVLSKNNRREQLWMFAVKLVLKGFLVQMKKLERDRNKMLLELNCNDVSNFNILATSIIQKDSFIKTIKHQMHTFHKASMFQKPSDNSYVECIKN